MSTEKIDTLTSLIFDKDGCGRAQILRPNGSEVPLVVEELVQAGKDRLMLVIKPRRGGLRLPYLVQVEDPELTDYLAKYFFTPS